MLQLSGGFEGSGQLAVRSHFAVVIAVLAGVAAIFLLGGPKTPFA